MDYVSKDYGLLGIVEKNKYRKPLILQGTRQVGKTYSILEFGRIHYENVAYFNFETNPKLNKTFEENISPDYLIPILSHIAENYVNVQLSINGYSTYYWESRRGAEIDFVIQRDNQLIPIEGNKKVVPLYAAFCI